MNVLNFPLGAFGIVLTILVFAFGVRRLLGPRLPLLRTLLAGVIAFFVAQPIIDAIGGPAVGHDAPVLPGLWFVLLGVVIALLVGMIFLVVSEALVPSGSLPGPVYLARSLRRQAGRTRRYAQITRILVPPRRPPPPGGRPPVRAGQRRRAGPPGSLAAAGPGGRRGHVRQARPGAVHPARPAAAGVHHRAVPAAGRRAPSALAGDRSDPAGGTGRRGGRGLRYLRPAGAGRGLHRPGAPGHPGGRPA